MPQSPSAPSPLLVSSATFSRCRTYRYVLRRTWDAARPPVLFIGLNPSTADETSDDPTIRRCIGFARRWNRGGLVMANIFAYRSTDPHALGEAEDPVGPHNNRWLRRLQSETDLVIAAWGAWGSIRGRGDDVLALLTGPYCLGRTRSGAPRHPLYLRRDTRVTPF